MSDQKYRINVYAVLFHPELDELNNYETIVCDWDNENIFKIDKNAYRILKIIDENPGISLDEIFLCLAPKSPVSSHKQNKIREFLDTMAKQNILFQE